jgi:hypothetical protein
MDVLLPSNGLFFQDGKATRRGNKGLTYEEALKMLIRQKLVTR